MENIYVQILSILDEYSRAPLPDSFRRQLAAAWALCNLLILSAIAVLALRLWQHWQGQRPFWIIRFRRQEWRSLGMGVTVNSMLIVLVMEVVALPLLTLSPILLFGFVRNTTLNVVAVEAARQIGTVLAFSLCHLHVCGVIFPALKSAATLGGPDGAVGSHIDHPKSLAQWAMSHPGVMNAWIFGPLFVAIAAAAPLITTVIVQLHQTLSDFDRLRSTLVDLAASNATLPLTELLGLVSQVSAGQEKVFRGEGYVMLLLLVWNVWLILAYTPAIVTILRATRRHLVHETSTTLQLRNVEALLTARRSSEARSTTTVNRSTLATCRDWLSGLMRSSGESGRITSDSSSARSQATFRFLVAHAVTFHILAIGLIVTQIIASIRALSFTSPPIAAYMSSERQSESPMVRLLAFTLPEYCFVAVVYLIWTWGMLGSTVNNIRSAAEAKDTTRQSASQVADFGPSKKTSRDARDGDTNAFDLADFEDKHSVVYLFDPTKEEIDPLSTVESLVTKRE